MLKANKVKGQGITDTNLLLIITIVVFFVMYISAIIMAATGVFNGEAFLRPQMFLNILIKNSPLIIIACGMSIVMITGGIDISVGGVVSLVCMCCAMYLDQHDGSVFGAILIALGIGVIFGVVQGYLVAYLELQPFIVTLAGMFFAKGMTTIVNSNPFNVSHEGFVELKDTRIVIPGLGYTNRLGKYLNAYINVGVIVAIVIVIVLFAFLRWTKSGRKFYAVGGNNQSALMLGINVKKTKFLSHLICSILAGVGGFVYFMFVGSGDPSHGSGMEMDAIAASIIGGTLLTGGVGNIIGTLFGVLSLATIQNVVSSMGLDEPWWIKITVALMLCIFLVIQSIVLARKKRGLKKES